MAVYRQIHVTFWQDDFVLDLTPEEKYFYLYLMTNSKTTQCGIYEIPKRIIQFETGYNAETVDKLLKRFIEYGKILYCEETKEVMLLRWIKYNGSTSPKVKACVSKELKNVKCGEFLNRYLSLCIEYGYSIDTQAQKEKEKEQPQEKTQEEEQPSIIADNPFKFYTENIGPMMPMVSELITQYGDDLPDGLLTEAMRIAVKKNARNLTYIEKIWQNWISSGIKTMDDYKRHEAEREGKKTVPGGDGQAPKQRVYTEEEVKAAAGYIRRNVERFTGESKRTPKEIQDYIDSDQFDYEPELKEKALQLLKEEGLKA
jgi:DnaD/phage-associated family protein